MQTSLATKPQFRDVVKMLPVGMSVIFVVGRKKLRAKFAMRFNLTSAIVPHSKLLFSLEKSFTISAFDPRLARLLKMRVVGMSTKFFGSVALSRTKLTTKCFVRILDVGV